MRRFLPHMILLLLVALVPALTKAQDSTALVLDQRVSGEITNDNSEIKYTFSGKKDEFITVTMMPDPDGSDLDPFLELHNSEGDTLAKNDDALDGISLIVEKLPADGDYTIVASRYDGSGGDSTGKFWIEVSDVKPLTVGAKTSVSIKSEFEKSVPTFYVYEPDSSGTVKFGFNVESGAYPQVGLFRYVKDDYPEILIQAEFMRNVSNVSFNAELKSGNTYVLMIDPVPVFYNTDETTTLTFSLG